MIMQKEKIAKAIAEFWDRHHKTEVSKDYWTCHPIINEYVNSMISPESGNILEWFAKNYTNSKPFSKGLSLGCGTGVAERQAIQAGLCLFMDGIDISPASVEVARSEALKTGMGDRLRYSVSDLNSLKLPARHYDCALCIGSLHHIENLEHVFDELRNSLKPDAYLLINEYVGPSRLQWTKKQLDILNRGWEIMPPEFRKAGSISPVNKEDLIKVDPSEAVRSSEIVSMLYNYFEVVEHTEYGGSFLMPFWSQGIMPDIFLDRPSVEKQIIVKLLCLIDELILNEKILPSCYVQIVARNKPPVSDKPSNHHRQKNNRKRWTCLWLSISDTERTRITRLPKKAFYVLRAEGFFPLLRAVYRYSKKILFAAVKKNERIKKWLSGISARKPYCQPLDIDANVKDFGTAPVNREEGEWSSLLNRETVAKAYLRGNGIEIGALHNPLEVSGSARVKYVDRMSVSELRKHYPELDSKELVNVDIIDNGEFLESIQDSTQDFVIANHFIEHCQNPIAAINNMLRVLKGGGMIYLSIPDKRYTFDKDRPLTPIDHILKDYTEGPEWSKEQHFEEWVKVVGKIQDDLEAKRRIDHLMDIDYSIHYHVWTQNEMLELISTLKKKLNFQSEVRLFFQNEGEVIFILKKLAKQSALKEIY